MFHGYVTYVAVWRGANFHESCANVNGSQEIVKRKMVAGAISGERIPERIKVDDVADCKRARGD